MVTQLVNVVRLRPSYNSRPAACHVRFVFERVLLDRLTT
jgi:hypothetical protein